jgi:hypothetical protein
MRLPGRLRSALDQLIELANRLKSEAADFLENPEEQQDWYNRGYANGIVKALNDLGYAAYIDGRATEDDADLLREHRMLAWGQAYQHGMEMGEKETREVISPAPEQ